jgi:hypothetical protein
MLPQIYKSIQKTIVDEINIKYGLNMIASDALLLANIACSQTEFLSSDQKQMIAPFLRGENYRFCLTPFFEEKEKLGKV